MKTKFTTRLQVIAATAFLSITPLFSASAVDVSSAPPNRGESAIMSSEVRAKVKAIDYKTREVTLQKEDGKEFTFVAGDEIKNLNKVKKGDTVVANHTEELVYVISKSGKATAPTEKKMISRSRAGSNPEGVVAKETKASVIISAIDTKTPSITFKNSEGKTQKFKVQRPEKLSGLKVGDTVEITYTESLALKVDPTK